VTLTALPLAALAGASPSPSPSIPEIDPARATPGLWGLFFFVVLGLATWFLFRSMNKQLKRVTFDESAPGAGAGPVAAGPGASEPGPVADSGGSDAPAAGGPAQSDPGPALR
jgi:hypothetical protein